MTDVVKANSASPVINTGSAPGSPIVSTTAPAGTGDATSGIVWGPVARVKSGAWSWISWPFKAFGSLLSNIWGRISSKIWKQPEVVKDFVTVKVPGTIYGFTLKKVPIQEALRNKWYTVEQGIKDKAFTLEQAQQNGWISHRVSKKGYLYNTNHRTLVKDAIEAGDLTVAQAIELNYITPAQVKNATWLKQVATAKK